MIAHNSAFELLAKAPVKTSDVKVVRQVFGDTGYTDSTPSWTSSTILMEAKIDSVGQMLGTVTKKATVKLLGVVSGIAVSDIYQIRLGLWSSSTSAFNYVSQGFFLVDTIDYDYEAGSTTVVMYDHMWRASNLLYEETGASLVYPATVESLAGQIASLLNVSLMANFSLLPNSQYSIAEDLYAEISDATIQNVIQDIAGATGTTARITDTTLVFSQYGLNSTSWSVVQSTSGQNSATSPGNTFTATINGVSPGNALILVMTGPGNTSIPTVALTDNTGNTWNTVSGAFIRRDSSQWTAFGKVGNAVGGNTTITVSIGAFSWGAGQWYIMEVAGLDSGVTTATIDPNSSIGASINIAGASYGMTLGSFTTTQAHDMFVLVAEDSWNGTTVTDANFTTLQHIGSTNRSLLVRDTGAAGVKAFTVSGMTQEKHTYAGISFKSATAGVETLGSAELKTLKIGDTYGPVTSVILGRVPQNDNIAIFATNPAFGTVTGVNTTTNVITVVGHGMQTGNMVQIQGAP